MVEMMDDLASPELAEKLDKEDRVEKVRSGDGQEEIAGTGESDGEGDEAQASGGGVVAVSTCSLIIIIALSWVNERGP